MKVPFFDARRGDLAHEEELLLACKTVLRRGSYILGHEVEAFEREAAAYLGARHAVGVSSGTDALIVALLALGIGTGDEVVVPAYTFVATASAVVRVGARPVFVDVDPGTLCIADDDPSRWSPTVKATVPVHLFGRTSVARFDGGPPIIEDAAQAFGAHSHGYGVMACHSFYPTKNLASFGDGGLVTTNDDGLAERLRMLRWHGSRERYRHEEIGGNFRLDELQAAMLRVKLRYIDEALGARALNAATYFALFNNAPITRQALDPAAFREIDRTVQRLKSIVLPPTQSDTWNQFVIRVHGDGTRDRLRAHLAERGVGTEVYYPIPLHLQPCFAGLGYGSGDFPVAEQAARETLTLPIFPGLTADEIAYVVESIAAFFK